MKYLFLVFGFFIFMAGKADEGKDLFQVKCSACHSIGQGRLVGPDLYDISAKRDHAWLVNFIRSSQTMIKSADQKAVAVYEQHNKILMPDANLSDAEIGSILNYIEVTSKEGGLQEQIGPAPDMLASATKANIEAGFRLFSGSDKLSNRGQACISCHNVKDNAIFIGGTLAKELTVTYETMGSAGVAAILKSPPFPAMKYAYANHALTEEEVFNLSAYLKSVSKNRYYQNTRDYSLLFIVSGIFVFVTVYISILILYFQRKKGSVRDDIFNRQKEVFN